MHNTAPADAQSPPPPQGAPRRLPPLEVDRRLIADPALKAVAARLEAGRRLGWEEGMALMTSRDLLGLGALGLAARRALHRRRAYYVINRHLNYSNVCVNRCAFCAFWREPGAEGAYTLSPREAAALAAAQPEPALSELHVVGSCHPELGLDYYLELLRALKRARPRAALKAFTPVEIDHMARREGLEVKEVLARLKQAGLAAMPGGGAEVFSPRVRARLCPRKISGRRWLEICGQAHRLGIPTNATMLYGHIETPRERVEHLLMLRRQQDATGGFNAFIPLAFHPLNTALSQAAPTGGLDDLRLIAASRLLLDNFPHIKAYWVMLGEKLAGVALNFGADDLDGTIGQENITHAAGATSARGLSETRLRQLITAAGFTPVRRDAFYHSLEDGRP